MLKCFCQMDAVHIAGSFFTTNLFLSSLGPRGLGGHSLIFKCVVMDVDRQKQIIGKMSEAFY